MKSQSAMLDYFGRIEIIHLAARNDRFKRLQRSLKELGIELEDQRVRIPHAEVVDTEFGYSSKQVYGNFLSHLDILQRALKDECKKVLILEDDAIFRSKLSDMKEQHLLCQELDCIDWDILYLGHPITKDLVGQGQGLLVTKKYFKWAHCYAIKKSILPKLVSFLEQTMQREAGHPLGGKLYIDGAFAMFREQNPDAKCVIHNPTLSVQAGSQSGIASAKWYDRIGLLGPLLRAVRILRDELWRRYGIFESV